MVDRPICVIGAGLSGLAAVRALVDRGLPVECFERGSAVGGLWRYEHAWRVLLSGGEERRYAAVVVASGLYRTPSLPDLPGVFAGEAIHSRDYRTPDRFAGRRVMVVGAGQSALDIAAELSEVAAQTMLACRRGHHIVPRYLFGVPFDRFDTDPGNRAPLPVVRAALGVAVALGRARPGRGDLPEPDHPVLEQTWPAVATDRMVAALETRAVVVKPIIEWLMGACVRFADGSEAPVDAIVYATGYRMSFAFLPGSLGRAQASQFPLYRRIVSPRASGLYFIGMLEPGPRLPAIIERQAAWLGELLTGRLAVPPPERMWAAIDAAEPRTRQQFAARGPHTVFCDGHSYGRLLASDLRRARAPRRRRRRVGARNDAVAVAT